MWTCVDIIIALIPVWSVIFIVLHITKLPRLICIPNIPSLMPLWHGFLRLTQHCLIHSHPIACVHVILKQRFINHHSVHKCSYIARIVQIDAKVMHPISSVPKANLIFVIEIELEIVWGNFVNLYITRFTSIELKDVEGWIVCENWWNALGLENDEV